MRFDRVGEKGGGACSVVPLLGRCSPSQAVPAASILVLPAREQREGKERGGGETRDEGSPREEADSGCGGFDEIGPRGRRFRHSIPSRLLHDQTSTCLALFLFSGG